MLEMSAGYVYILTNPSLAGMIKVGRTVRDSRARAREISGATGVPTPFDLAYEIFSDEHEQLETAMHTELAPFRVANNREFFRYPLNEAIQLLSRLAVPSRDPAARYAAESILGALRARYADWLKSDIIDVRIVQTSERVWLEITQEHAIGNDLRDQIIRRADLAFISSGLDFDRYFPPANSVSDNARRFVEQFEPYSIVQTTICSRSKRAKR